MAQSEKISFTGGSGETLAARIEWPAEPPRAWALFAHCFSCSKEVLAATRISRALCARGIAVLRFDFTGLGASDGDFANTNFSSNVEDLLAAADFLRTSYDAPQILIGHSLGGAAVLMAAASMPDVKAVATIGAPADVSHVSQQFADSIRMIEDEGMAEVNLGGRPFTIKKQFLDDLKIHSVTEAVREMRCALLVMHAPLDEVVGIDNASDIFVQAKHPKSFISLDDADHFLTRREDGEYAARVISAWSARYIKEAMPESDPLEDTQERTVTVRETGEGYGAEMAAGRHRLAGDQPAPAGGDTGPTPYDYLAMALGLCTTQTLRMYAGRKKLDMGALRIDISYDKKYTDDCEGCADGKGIRQIHMTSQITLPPGLSAEAQARLLEIAHRCPVHKALAHDRVSIDTTIEN